jgi:hypothetical protein
VKRFLRLLGHPLLVPVWVLAVAALVLLPRLGTPGFWEPQELAVADAASARADAADAADPDDTLAPVVAVITQGQLAEAVARGEAVRCRREAAEPDGPRTLTERLAARGLAPVESADADMARRRADLGLPSVESADTDMRLRLAGLGILCVLASAGIAFRLAGARAAAIAAAACLSFPLLVLQSRQLTSDIGTATGAALLVYGALALARPARGVRAIADVAVAAAAIAAGWWLAWNGGGSLLGLIPPLAAIAIVGGLGIGLLPAVGRAGAQLLVRLGGAAAPRLAVGRRRPFAEVLGRPGEIALALLGLVATVALAILAVRLFTQIYDLRSPVPGTRAILGKSIIAAGCWSNDLGGVWKIDDDLRATYDSLFEPIAFGLFPVGIVAPVAMAALAMAAGGADRDRLRLAGILTIAWAGAAWFAAQTMQRKVGPVLWPGFPAAAVAIAVWVDAVWATRDRVDVDHDAAPGPATIGGFPARSLLVAVFVFLGAVTLGKDLVAFPEKLVSLLVGGDAIKYPKTGARWLGVSLKSWVLVCGVGFGGLFALGIGLWRARRDHDASPWSWLGRRGLVLAFAAAIIVGLFWVHVWHGLLSHNLSSKRVFTTFRTLRADGEPLGIMGDMANAPRYYAGGAFEKISGRDGLATFLASSSRVFALVPAAELCPIHRQFAGKPYHVLDDSNVRSLLLSNRLDGAADKNPLARAIQRSEPTDIKARPSGRVVWDNKIELVGWTLPDKVRRGDAFQATLYFKILGNVPGSWKIFAHFDGGGLRFQGDHDPIGGRCATSYWQTGDYIVDTFTVEAGDVTFQRRDYELRAGFFTGSSPNWKNMPISEAPASLKDKNERVLVGKVRVD